MKRAKVKGRGSEVNGQRSTTTVTRRVGASLVMAGVLVGLTIAVPMAQRRNRGDNSIHGVPVATNTIARAPDKYYGKLVTVSAAVDGILSKTVFVVDQRKAVGANEVTGVGTPLLVIAPHLAGALEQNRYFLVRGEVFEFTAEELATVAPGYALDLPTEVLEKYVGRPALVASSILDSKYAELAKPPAPPVAAPK